MSNPTIGFIGYGNMAQAIAEGLVAAGAIDGTDIVACAAHYDKLEKTTAKVGATPLRTAAEVADAADVVIIAIKPYQIESVIKPIAGALANESTFVVSIAAGWDLARYRELFGADFGAMHIQCTIPNTPAVGSCMGALVFGSRELKGSRWRHMIMFLALMTVGFVVIHLCQGNLIVMGLVEILTGLTISPVFASGNLVVKETVPEESLTEGLSWVSTAGTMGASFGSMITGIVLDHFNPSAGLSLPAVFVGCSIPFALIGWLLVRRRG